VNKCLKVPKDWQVKLETGFRRLSIGANSEARSKILLHLGLVKDECRRTNLVSQRDRDFLVERHVMPSLAALPFVDDRPVRAICIGSGAGFPGVEIKIFRPRLQLTLLEATKKKTNFLKCVVKELGLSETKIVWDRAENLHDAGFELAMARGVAPMAKLQELAAPLLIKGGRLIAWKGSRFSEEMQAVRKAKFEIEKVHEYDAPRILVILRKI
jgi:16S rRNA (guanine527-N7)-methyltransferase